MSTITHLTAICIYRVQAGKEDEFFGLLRKHYPALKGAGLATDDEPIIYRGAEQDGRPIIFEIFSWKNADAPKTAHQLPEVMAVWEPMGALVEERDGRPKFEFPHVEKVEMTFGNA